MQLKATLTSFFYITLTYHLLALSPSKEYLHHPDDFGMNYKSVEIPLAENGQLNAWYMEVAGSHKLVIVSHEGTQNMSAHLSRAKLFHKLGFSVLSYDYRGFGSSSAFNIDPLQYIYQEFYQDLGSVISYAQQQFDQQIVLYGWGIGAAVSLYHGFNTANILGVIADDPFVSKNGLSRTFREKKTIMKSPDISSEYEPLSFVSKPCKGQLRGLLYLHGEKNRLVSNQEIQQLYDKTNFDFKDLQLFSKSGPIENYKMNRKRYEQLVYVFVLNL